jgi:hypothetical protein
MRPYSGRFSQQVIDTCKFIGEAVYRAKNEFGSNPVLITRNEVKKWVFDTFPAICNERIAKRIEYMDGYKTGKGERGYRKKDGELKKPTFHWVDDRVCIAAMKEYWKIPTPKPGKKNIYELSAHSWQALALGTCYIQRSRTAEL